MTVWRPPHLFDIDLTMRLVKQPLRGRSDTPQADGVGDLLVSFDASRQRFVYARTKFGSTFDEDIVHPQDDECFDVFAVVARVEDAAAPVRGRPASRG